MRSSEVNFSGTGRVMCQYRLPPVGRRVLGQKCQRPARWYVCARVGQVGMNVCTKCRDRLAAADKILIRALR